MRLRDRVRTETVVQRVAWRLSWGSVSSRRQREVLRELRANLAAAADAGDLDAALERLGDARELADSYLDAIEPRFRWQAGLLWAFVAWGLVTWLTVALAIAFSAGVDAGLTGGDGTGGRFVLWDGFAFGDPLFVEERPADERTVIGTWSLLTPLHLAGMLLAFVGASRPWRLLRR